MAKTATEALLFIQCEKIVNETWAKTSLHYDQLNKIILNGGPLNEDEEAIIMIAANATLQKMTLDRAKDEMYIL